MSFEEKTKTDSNKIAPSPGLLLGLAMAVGLIFTAPPKGNALDHAGPQDSAGRSEATVEAVSSQKQRLLEQVLTYLERKLPTTQAGKGARLEKEKSLLLQAREAAANGDHDLAETLIDEALSSATRLARSLGRSKPGQAALRSRYRELHEAVTQFREALADAARNKGLEPSKLQMNAVDTHLENARKLAREEKFNQANFQLSSAYHLVATQLAEVRANETVEQRLDFDTPADEFRYERNRYESHQRLVRMILRGRELNGDSAERIRINLDAAAVLHEEAEDHGEQGDFTKAVKSEEAAVDHLINALQNAGLYVPK